MRTLSLLPILLSCMAWGQAPNYISGEKGPTHIVHPVRIQADYDTSLVWDDPKGTLPLTCMPDATKTGWVCKVAPKPEPMDVPAKKERMWLICTDSRLCPDVWTCADKSRVLLTDESGGKHCLKFPSGAKD